MRGRHSLRAARRDLRGLPEYEREAAMAWFTAVEDRWRTFVIPSQLATKIELRMLTAAFGYGEYDPNHRGAMVAVNMGYAARMLDLEEWRRIARDFHGPGPPLANLRWSDRDLSEFVPRDESGAIAHDEIDDDGDVVAELADYATGYASEPEPFMRVLLSDLPRWNAMTSLMTVAFHKNLRATRAGDARVLNLTNLDYLMRVGYVLRCIDETLGEQPRTLAEVEAGKQGTVGLVKRKSRSGGRRSPPPAATS
jgi:hypothetical protein